MNNNVFVFKLSVLPPPLPPPINSKYRHQVNTSDRQMQK